MLATAAVGVRHVNRRTTRWMRAETWRSPGATYQPNDSGRTWLWSDLHLHHANIIRYCRRPFESVDEMDSALLRAWETTVDPGDTIICGGDVALARALDPLRLARLSAMPGRKVLVLGNHDFGPTGKPSETGSDEASMTLVIPGEPTLLMTHIPLWNVPAGRVNVHGHVHNHERLRPGPFINICVEQTGYRPLPLEAVRGAGRQPARGPAAAGRDHPRGDRAARRRGRGRDVNPACGRLLRSAPHDVQRIGFMCGDLAAISFAHEIAGPPWASGISAGPGGVSSAPGRPPHSPVLGSPAMQIKLVIEEPQHPAGYRIVVYCGACNRFVWRITAAAMRDRIGASNSALPLEKRSAAVDAERRSAVAAADGLDLAYLVSRLEEHDCAAAVPPAP